MARPWWPQDFKYLWVCSDVVDVLVCRGAKNQQSWKRQRSQFTGDPTKVMSFGQTEVDHGQDCTCKNEFPVDGGSPRRSWQCIWCSCTSRGASWGEWNIGFGCFLLQGDVFRQDEDPVEDPGHSGRTESLSWSYWVSWDQASQRSEKNIWTNAFSYRIEVEDGNSPTLTHGLAPRRWDSTGKKGSFRFSWHEERKTNSCTMFGGGLWKINVHTYTFSTFLSFLCEASLCFSRYWYKYTYALGLGGKELSKA